MQALVTWPAPEPPISVTDLPMQASTGLTLSKAAASPPTMMVSPPLIAPTSPPDTGASSIVRPFSAIRAAIAWAAAGAMVLMSTKISPGFAPSATPPAPSATCSTSAASETIENTTSQPAATSAALPAPLAPASSSGAIDSARRAHTVSSNPPLRMLSAIGRPMMPRPTKPIFMNCP